MLMPTRQHPPMRSHITTGWTGRPALQITCLFSWPLLCLCNGPMITAALVAGMEAMHESTIWTLPQYSSWSMPLLSFQPANSIKMEPQPWLWQWMHNRKGSMLSSDPGVPGFYHQHWGLQFSGSLPIVNSKLEGTVIVKLLRVACAPHQCIPHFKVPLNCPKEPSQMMGA